MPKGNKPFKIYTISIIPTDGHGRVLNDFVYPTLVEKFTDRLKTKLQLHCSRPAAIRAEPDFIVRGDVEQIKEPIDNCDVKIQEKISVLQNSSIRNAQAVLAKIIRETLLEVDPDNHSPSERAELLSNRWQKRLKQDEWMAGLGIRVDIEHDEHINQPSL